MNDRGTVRRLRVCVCTSGEGIQEPRAPRHAAWLAQFNEAIDVIFVDSAPFGTARRPVKVFESLGNMTWRTHYYASRSSGVARLLRDRITQAIARSAFRFIGTLTPSALSTHACRLERILEDCAADVYLAHNIETLLPAYRVSRRSGGLTMFDSMEFYSDMGDSQTPQERDLINAIERECLPQCALVLASSDQVADELAKEYTIERPLPLYNVPEVEKTIAQKPMRGFELYWRNSVVGLGQRGLDEALVALSQLDGEEITLHLQGRLPLDGGAALKRRIAALELDNRVFFHAPYSPENAVKEAAQHTVGLCLERRGCRNHDLTVSNKIFDYHMAGLVSIASDLPGLRGVIKRSCGGLLFEPGSAEDLSAKIRSLYHDQEALQRYSTNAREFALREGNRDVERTKFCDAFREACRDRVSWPSEDCYRSFKAV